MEMSADIISHSISDSGVELPTIECVYPRIILAEINTHRVLTRNGASSRAIPFPRLVQTLRDNHFAPVNWLENMPGMASTALMTSEAADECNAIWLEAMEDAIKHATRLHENRASKQYLNRLLEPFLMTRTLISATRWKNLFALRDEKGAQPEFRDLAQMMKEALEKSSPELKTYGDVGAWHLPYITEDDREAASFNPVSFPIPHDRVSVLPAEVPNSTLNLMGMSVARCCRVSGKTFDGAHLDFDADVRTFAKLNDNPLHASPMEHVAYPLPDSSWEPDLGGNFHGWVQLRKLMPNEAVEEANFNALVSW